MKNFIIISTKIAGFHNYPEAKNFLKYKHRHEFKIVLKIEVTELNRELEYYEVEEKLKQFLKNEYGEPCEFKNKSCEHICNEIIYLFDIQGLIEVQVWEDNLFGSITEK